MSRTSDPPASVRILAVSLRRVVRALHRSGLHRTDTGCRDLEYTFHELHRRCLSLSNKPIGGRPAGERNRAIRAIDGATARLSNLTQPRSGSNLLCQSLLDTDRLGNPLEYFNGPGGRALGYPTSRTLRSCRLTLSCIWARRQMAFTR